MITEEDLWKRWLVGMFPIFHAGTTGAVADLIGTIVAIIIMDGTPTKTEILTARVKRY